MRGADINDEHSRGIIPRALSQIFYFIDNYDNADIEFEVRVSVLEIYLEKLYDLLNEDENSPKLDIKSLPSGVIVKGLIEECVNDEEELLYIFDEAEKRREVDTTKLNKTSSRSHMVFRLEIRQKHKYDETEKRGVLNLVDLAGSEKLKQSNTSGKTLEEAKKINLSLLYLGTVIEEISSGKNFVSYHSSKLTSLLKDSLGGNFKTTVIVTCSPSIYNVVETISSLRFSQRAKKIKNKVKINIKLSNEQYEKIIQQLKSQLYLANEEIKRLGGVTVAQYTNKHTGEVISADLEKLMREKDEELFKLRDTVSELTVENFEMKKMLNIYEKT
jgi:kinesin family protein 5